VSIFVVNVHARLIVVLRLIDASIYLKGYVLLPGLIGSLLVARQPAINIQPSYSKSLVASLMYIVYIKVLSSS